MTNHPNRSRHTDRYAVAEAPGHFGHTTEIISIHPTFHEALTARGNKLRLAVYQVGAETAEGATLYSDMMPPRVDRDPRRPPDVWVEPSRDGRQYWLCGMPDEKAARPNMYSRARGDGVVMEGPFPSHEAAEKAKRKWVRIWAGSPVWSPSVPSMSQA